MYLEGIRDILHILLFYANFYIFYEILKIYIILYLINNITFLNVINFQMLLASIFSFTKNSMELYPCSSLWLWITDGIRATSINFIQSIYINFLKQDRIIEFY